MEGGTGEEVTRTLSMPLVPAWARTLVGRNLQSVVDSGGLLRQEDSIVVGCRSAPGRSAAPALPVDAAGCTGFRDLPDELLEHIFGFLEGNCSRKTYFAVCGVCRKWRRLGRKMFFASPWNTPHLICHPDQLFCLSPRTPTGSRSGMLKCYLKREPASLIAGSGSKITMYLGKDPNNLARSRFLVSALRRARLPTVLFLNSRCEGQPCARLMSNLLCTSYTLVLEDGMAFVIDADDGKEDTVMEQLGVGWEGGPDPPESPLSSWTAQNAVGQSPFVGSSPLSECGMSVASEPRETNWLGISKQTKKPSIPKTLMSLRYKARIRGIMQPRRMDVVLPKESTPRGSLPQRWSPSPKSSPFIIPQSIGLPARMTGLADEGALPACLKNKAPHWNEALRCWCLNFRGRVKLASVKNFQLVRSCDPDEKVIMQFGKVERDAFILDFNPTALSAVQAFAIALSTFDSKLML